VTGGQTELTEFGPFDQPPHEDRETVVRTLVVQIPTLTAKKAGLLNRAMKDYRRARALVCDRFHENDPSEVTQNESVGAIHSRDDVELLYRQVAYAYRTVEQNYNEYQADQSASPPEANRADTLVISRKRTYIFHENGRYYLNVSTGKGKVNVPLRTSDDAHHTDYFPHPSSVPVGKSNRGRDGKKVSGLTPEDFPSRTQRLSTSTIQKRGSRRFTANLSFQIATKQERTYDIEEARYVVGVDRGRNQLAYAALYDREDDHVTDWFNRSGDEVKHYTDELAARISQFQSAGVWEQMEDARKRRYRYKEQVDYEIANAVVDLARDADGSVVIVLEDLQGMSKLGNYAVENRRFNEWSYYRLGQFIEQKAAPYDIPVERVDPYETSQECSRCGESDVTVRDGTHFECDACGYEQHADANAAVNVAKRFDDRFVSGS
jgi:IS605 OrfB family transposase